MAEYIEQTAVNADGLKKNKIKTHFAQIIVGNKTVEKPYYSILYFDPTDREYHIGFSSFCLDYVFEWLSEEFEIVEGAADVVEVVKCKECKHYRAWPDGQTTCAFWTDQWDMPTDADAFCSYGERREPDVH